MSYLNITSHRGMAFDAVRNEAYVEALRQVIRPDSVVLDVGAGTGIHGLIAATLGARRVYLVEPEDIIAVAEESVRANGLHDVVQCIQGRIEDVTLPEPVDVIVSVLTGNFLFTEDLLPALFAARDRFLKPGGTLLPSEAVLEVAPVAAPAVFEREIASWSVPECGVDLSPGRQDAANTLLYLRDDLRQARDLAQPTVLHTTNLLEDTYGPLQARTSTTIDEPGECHGWAGWFRMKLADRWLTTSPRAPKVHWNPVFLPLDPPMNVEKGEELTLEVARPPYGEWTWKTSSRTGVQRHSTLLSTPLKTGTLEKASLDYAPVLGESGRAAFFVLQRCQGAESMAQIAAALREEFPQRFYTHTEALRFSQSIVKQYA